MENNLEIECFNNINEFRKCFMKIEEYSYFCAKFIFDDGDTFSVDDREKCNKFISEVE